MTRTAAEKAALARDGQECRRCGRWIQDERASLHHRQLKAHGAKERYDKVENLVLLCGSATTPGSCHQWAHNNVKAAMITGWIVSRYTADISSQPLITELNTMLCLLPDGTAVIDPLITLPDVPSPWSAA